MRTEILEILEEMHPDVDFETCTSLVDDKVLDSFDIVTLIGELNDAFDISVPAEAIKPENFNSLDALTEMVRRLADED